jgi:hypothetical protein
VTGRKRNHKNEKVGLRLPRMDEFLTSLGFLKEAKELQEKP